MRASVAMLRLQRLQRNQPGARRAPPEPGSPATKLTAELVVENVEAFLPAPALPEIYPEIWIDASGYLTSQPPPHIDDDDAYEDGTAHDEYEAAMATEL